MEKYLPFTTEYIMEKNILPSVNCKMEKYFYLTSTIVLFLFYIVLFALVFALV